MRIIRIIKEIIEIIEACLYDIYDNFLVFIMCFITCFILIMGLLATHYNAKHEIEIIELYKTYLSDKNAVYIEKVCYSNIKCWNRERAILSGMEVEEKCRLMMGKIRVCEEHYYLKGADIDA